MVTVFLKDTQGQFLFFEAVVSWRLVVISFCKRNLMESKIEIPNRMVNISNF